MQTFHITSEDELKGIAVIVLGAVVKAMADSQASVLAISGDLGAGKTTFMQVLAKELHIKEPVISPTYVIMKRYEVSEDDVEIFKTLVHIDAYRIEDIDEMRVLRFEEVLAEKDTIICIEWAEKIEELLPAHTVHHMNIEIKGESRVITIS
jgi:tRNA threonylcarbamoyladenosine biosynthesis protein TsaE